VGLTVGQVRVIKAFSDPRTPCPALGSVGEIIGYTRDQAVVRFSLPLKTSDNTELLRTDNHTFIDVYFNKDEVEAVPAIPKATA
jgi:hypothetical protein